MLHSGNDTMELFFNKRQPEDSPLKMTEIISEGNVEKKKYRNYYDVNHTITTAQATDPSDTDHPNYNVEAVFQVLQRRPEKIYVTNDETVASGRILYVIASHNGSINFSRERPIYPQEYKEYNNIYELRLRSATQGHAYRVSEYKISAL